MSYYRLRPDGGPTPGWRILTLAGIPFYVEPFFLIFLAVIVIQVFQRGMSVSQAGLLGFVIFFSLLAHEAGHALTAWVLGYRGISVSLVALGGQTRHPPATRGHSLLIVLAGPLVTVALVGIAYGLQSWLPGLLAHDAARFIIATTFVLNFYWAAFNLLPIYPLDGGQSLLYLLSFVLSQRAAILAVAGLSLVLSGLAIALYLLRLSFVHELGGFLLFLVIMFFIQNLQIIKAYR